MLKNSPKLYKRQKLLLAIVQAFGGKVSSVNLQKYLFLFTQICELEKSYEFVPYKFGCFSFQSYADRRKLIEFGYLVDDDSWSITPEAENSDFDLPSEQKRKINLFQKKFSHLKGDDLVREVYRKYPYFATRSEIAEKLMSTDELGIIEQARHNQSEPAFFTIGYEGNSFENYLNRLLQNNVRLLCDVRKNPLSRKYGFSKRTLSETLGKIDIEYVHLPDLGIVSDKRRELNSIADYQKLFDEYEATTLRQNTKSLTSVVELISKYKRVAITCFEAEHCMCHRSRVATALAARNDWNLPITHI